MYGRHTTLRLDDRIYDSDSIDMDFDVFFDSRSQEPDISQVILYNLSPDSRAKLEKGQIVTLTAGYKDGDRGSILVGEVADFRFRRTGPDTEAAIDVAPGIGAWMDGVVNKSFKPGIRASQVARGLLEDFGLEIGGIDLAEDVVYPSGRAFSGPLRDALGQVAKDCGSVLELRVNAVFIQQPKAGSTTATLISGRTGLIDPPERIYIDDEPGYKLTTLLNPALTYGSLVQIQSNLASGNFRVVSGIHRGDYTTELEVVPL